MTQVEAAFVTLYDAHYDEVHSFCARRVGWAEAGDVAADVFTVVWRRIDEVEHDTVRAWVFGIARGVLRNRWRSAARRARLVERVRAEPVRPPDGPEAATVRRSVDDEVIAALTALRRRDQEILRLAAWDDLSGPEIASVLGISLDAVHQRLSRAKRRLADELAGRGSA